MALVCPNVGEILLLRYIVNIARDDTDHNVLHLFENDATPSEATVASSFTEPSIGTGYDSITLIGTLWTIEQSGGVTTAVYGEETFTFTTGASVYGYFVSDTSGNLLWAERFDGAPFTMPVGGGTIAITAKLTLD